MKKKKERKKKSKAKKQAQERAGEKNEFRAFRNAKYFLRSLCSSLTCCTTAPGRKKIGYLRRYTSRVVGNTYPFFFALFFFLFRRFWVVGTKRSITFCFKSSFELLLLQFFLLSFSKYIAYWVRAAALIFLALCLASPALWVNGDLVRIFFNFDFLVVNPRVAGRKNQSSVNTRGVGRTSA